MKKSRFTEDEVVKILREADSVPVVAVARKYGISYGTIYAWRRRFGGLQAIDIKRLRELERKEKELEKLLAGNVDMETGSRKKSSD